MITPLDDLAVGCDLADERGVSPDVLRERYLYSRDMTYRYAFERWCGEHDLAITDVWMLLNPAPATPRSASDRRWIAASLKAVQPDARGC